MRGRPSADGRARAVMVTGHPGLALSAGGTDTHQKAFQSDSATAMLTFPLHGGGGGRGRAGLSIGH